MNFEAKPSPRSFTEAERATIRSLWEADPDATGAKVAYAAARQLGRPVGYRSAWKYNPLRGRKKPGRPPASVPAAAASPRHPPGQASRPRPRLRGRAPRPLPYATTPEIEALIREARRVRRRLGIGAKGEA